MYDFATAPFCPLVIAYDYAVIAVCQPNFLNAKSDKLLNRKLQRCVAIYYV
jgi:hypothetical protein